MTKIYTKTGDNGETYLYGGVRVSKNSKIIKLLGEIDELNSLIGFAWTVCENEVVGNSLKELQEKLYQISAELAGSREFSINSSDVENLEKLIDEFIGDKDFTRFVRPGEKGEFSARIHICRSICRKAERSAIKFIETENAISGDTEKYKYILQYLNRLSDLLFAIAEIE